MQVHMDVYQEYQVHHINQQYLINRTLQENYMSNNENKKDLLKKINDIDSKIENEKINIKHNNLIKEELNKINESYNRCLGILSQSAKGKIINQKYNDLYTENRNSYIKDINNIDNQLSTSQKNIEEYIKEKDILKEQEKEENDK